jgi:hypothetical protein
VNDQSKASAQPKDSSQVWMLSLQMQAMALAIEELRSRIMRIEHHLKLDRDTDGVRDNLSKLDRIW